MAKRDPKRGLYSATRQVGILTLIPLVLAVSPIVGLVIGRLLDRWLSTNPWLTIVFTILGFVAGGKEVANLVRRASEEEKADDREEPPRDGA